jgi:hypothetical protein
MVGQHRFTNGSCRSSASSALQLWAPSSSSDVDNFREQLRGRAKTSAERRFLPFNGCPSTSCPLSAELPRSSQYATLLPPLTLVAIS